MKLDIKLQGKVIGSLQVSTMPGISHKFEFDNTLYEIIKTTNDHIEVMVARQKVKKPNAKKSVKK